MGSIALVLVLIAAGILIGRTAGRSLAAHYLLALFATVVISIAFLMLISAG